MNTAERPSTTVCAPRTPLPPRPLYESTPESILAERIVATVTAGSFLLLVSCFFFAAHA